MKKNDLIEKLSSSDAGVSFHSCVKCPLFKFRYAGSFFADKENQQHFFNLIKNKVITPVRVGSVKGNYLLYIPFDSILSQIDLLDMDMKNFMLAIQKDRETCDTKEYKNPVITIEDNKNWNLK